MPSSKPAPSYDAFSSWNTGTYASSNGNTGKDVTGYHAIGSTIIFFFTIGSHAFGGLAVRNQSTTSRLPAKSDRVLRSRNKKCAVVALALRAVGLLTHTYANSGSELNDNPSENLAWLQGYCLVSRGPPYNENGDPLNIRAAQKKDWSQWKQSLLD